ncbi:MAG: lactate utilization protein [Deltaproteobacteria bacterium]|nr:lactate utilization protein [Deltaproteobacteria bacterium]
MSGYGNEWLWEKLAGITVQNLNKHDFNAHFFYTRKSALDFIFDMVSDFKTFGIGGSDTIRKLGIIDRLLKDGKEVYDHWQEGLTKEEDLAIRLKHGRCDCFLSSANAISATGEIVNVDGVGNRTCAMTFGPKQVILICGMNKVTPDLESALRRIQEVAGPLRAKSLEMDTPCAKTGICTDCNSPQRICRVTTILHRRPMLTPVEIVLINEALGF